jgi:hypothetical protein
MKKVNALLAALLSVTILFGGAIPAQAASAEVTVEVKATDVNTSVTVPSVLPIIFNEDGTNTYPTNWTIQNNSQIARVYLYSIKVDAVNDWTLMTKAQDPTYNDVDSKKIKFYAGVEDNMQLLDGTDSAYVEFDPSDCLILPKGGTKDLSFKVERGAYTQSQSAKKVLEMVLTFQYK